MVCWKRSSRSSKWLCKTKLFSVHVFACYGAFQIVLMTLDKVIAIKLPHRSASICTAKRARLLSLINFIIVIILYLPILEFSNMNELKNDCIQVCEGWVVCHCILLFCNCYQPSFAHCFIICHEYFHNHGGLGESTFAPGCQTGQQHSRNRTTEVQLTIMLILVSSMF